MSFTLRTIDPQSNFSSQITMQALEQVIPREEVAAVLTREQAWQKRERTFSMLAVVLVVITMNLYRHLALGHVIRRVAQGLRFLWPDPTYAVPGASAFSYRRYRLGVSALETLFKEVARPLATRETPGAFLFDRRLMRTLSPGMLVMWDRGLHSFDMLQAALERGADVLSRLPAHAGPEVIGTLPDGSQVVRLRPSEYHRRKQGGHLVLRLVEYTIADQTRPGHGQRHRLLTTLLDHGAAPAKELACAYHERWEVELTIDEIKTHELFSQRLRSQKPLGVLQELYGVLLAHFAVRALMHEAALAADLDPDRLSFVHALRVIGDAMVEFELVDQADLPRLYERLLSDLAAVRLPERRLRSNPRVVKRKMSNFKLKRRKHEHWPQPTKPFADVVALI